MATELFVEEIGTPFGFRRGAVNATGDAAFNNVSPGVAHTVGLRQNGVWDDVDNRLNDEFIYLKKDPTSLTDRDQTITSPSANGTETVEWVKYKNRLWIQYWRNYQNIIKANQAAGKIINYDTVTLVGTVEVEDTMNYYSGSILLPNNKILVSSRSPTTHPSLIMNIDDFSIDTQLTGITSDVIRAVLVGDSVVFVPYTGQIAVINDLSDPSTIEQFGPIFTTTVSPGAAMVDCNGYTAVSMWNNTASTYTFAYIDHINKTFNTLVTGTYSTLAGRIADILPIPSKSNCFFMVPNNTTVGQWWDIVKDTGAIYGVADSLLTKAYGGVLLADETGLAIARNSPTHKIHNPLALTITNIGPTDSSTNKWSCGLLLPDGRVLEVPYSKTSFSIFDPSDMSRTLFGPTFTWPNSEYVHYTRPTLLPDGRIFVPNGGTAQHAVISASDGDYGTLPDEDTLLSGWINR